MILPSYQQRLLVNAEAVIENVVAHIFFQTKSD